MSWIQKERSIMKYSKRFPKTYSFIFLGLLALFLFHTPYAIAVNTSKLYRGFGAPVGIGFDSKGNIYVAEWSANKVTRIDESGKRTTFAESLHGPPGLAIDSTDNVYVASYSDDLIYRYTPYGKRTLFAKDLATPSGLSFDSQGNLLVANRRTNEIISIAPNSEKKTVAESLQTPVGAVMTSEGSYFVSNINGGISLVTPDHSVATINS